MDNPRWPYYLILVRPKMDGDIIILDHEGNPIYEEVFASNYGERTQTSNTKTGGEVITCDHKISLPRHTFNIHTGDKLILTDATHTFEGRVLKAQTFNMGSNIWLDEIKYE